MSPNPRVLAAAEFMDRTGITFALAEDVPEDVQLNEYHVLEDIFAACGVSEETGKEPE